MIHQGKNRERIKQFLALQLLGALTLSVAYPVAWAAPDGLEVRTAQSAETIERQVDQVALAAQEQSISKLNGLLHKYRGKSQEPILLAKLGELYQQAAAIQFRIAHGKAELQKKKPNLHQYKGTLTKSITTLTELIRKYPRFEEIPHSYFLRGKSHEEIGAKDLAEKDYLHLVKTYPDAPEVISAYMALADFAIDANNHPRAIGFLNEVEKSPDAPQYPFALYKLAWSHYNLKNIPTALSYGERHVKYYDEILKEIPKGEDHTLASSDIAFRENMLMDITTFYVEGKEQGLEQYDAKSAMKYFRKLDKGTGFGRMLARYAKLLRSHRRDNDLIFWKNQVLAQEKDRPECLDVLIIVYEHELNQNHFDQMSAISKDFVELYKKHPNYASFAQAQKLLLDTADHLQKVLVKNKAATGVRKLSETLAGIYDSFVKIVKDEDPRIPGVHYNLAETLFEIQDYEGATTHYRWVVERSSWKEKDKKKLSAADSSLKAISARYQTLKLKKIVPENLEAYSFKDNSDKKLEPILAEWIKWIDTHIDKTDEPIEEFYFESNRALYHAKHVKDAIKRMRKFAAKHPKAKEAIPSASLALDTYIATQDWAETHDLAKDFLKVKAWKEEAFGKRLFSVAADASYKMVEERYKKNEFEKVLDGADEFLENYAKSERFADILMLAGNAALKANKKSKANDYYTRLIQDNPKSTSVGAAMLSRGKLAEDRYELEQAGRDYHSFLKLPEEMRKSTSASDQEKLRAKTLMLYWLSGNQELLTTALEEKTFCTEKLKNDCERFNAWIALSQVKKEVTEKKVAHAFDRCRKGPKEAQAIWAAAALTGSRHLAFRDRLLAIRQLTRGWDDLDPLFQFALIPDISEKIPEAFERNRAQMKEVAPLRANERYISRRIEVIQEMENTATRVLKAISWSKVRALTLNQMSELYVDLAKGLTQIPAPKDLPEPELKTYRDTILKLVMPFEEKAQDMRGKAFEIASRFAIEEASFHAVVDPYFRDNPSLAARIKPFKLPPRPHALDLEFLDELDSSGDWDDLSLKSDEPVMRLKARWAEALKAKQWPKVAFFLQEAKEKSLIRAGVMEAVRAVSLTAIGAQGEGLALLEDATGDLKEDAERVALRTLISYFAASFAREKSQEFLSKLAKKDPSSAAALQRQWAWEEPKNAQPSSDRKVAGDKS